MSRPFSLTGLLRLRKLQEAEAAAELAAANGRLRGNEMLQERARAHLAGLGAEATSASVLTAIAAARASARSTLADLSAVHAIVSADAIDAADAYRESRTRTTTLAKLEARHMREAALQELRGEQLALDEIAAGRAGREQEGTA